MILVTLNKNWLHSADIDDDAKMAIREKYFNFRNFSDDDIFQNLCHHQMHNNKQEASKWMARLSDSKQRDVIQLQKMALQSTAMGALSETLNNLLSYIGLWSALQLGTFHWLLTLRCPEISNIGDPFWRMIADSEQELTHYLHLIERTWKLILSTHLLEHMLLDANTVQILQTCCLRYFFKDHAAVTGYMDNGVLFPNIPEQSFRNAIKVSLEEIRYMISSLHTFLKDTKYLEPCAKIVKSLLLVKFKGMICEAFGKNHTGQSQLKVQLDEHTVSKHTESIRECIWIAYCQIWLFTMCHFSNMISICSWKDAERSKSVVHHLNKNLWHKIAELAVNCGFHTSVIAEYTRWSSSQKMASEFLHQCQSSEYYDLSTDDLNTAVVFIVGILQDIQPQEINFKQPPLTSDYQDNTDLADQCGRPFEQSFLDDKKYMFYQHIYDNRSESWTLQQRERYLTSFKVKQDIFIAFFGRMSEEPPQNMGFQVEPQDIAADIPQASEDPGSTGGPQHTFHNPETDNVPSAQTDTSESINETQRRQGVSQSDNVLAEGATGNDGQFSDSRVTDEGRPPGSQLIIGSPSRRQSQGQEEYATKRQRMNDATTDDPNAAMFEAVGDEVLGPQTEEYSNNNPVLAPTERPVTMMQSSSSQQQAVAHSPESMFDIHSPRFHNLTAAILQAHNEMTPHWEETSSLSHAVPMTQSTPPQQQIVSVYPDRIPVSQKTSDYVRNRCSFDPGTPNNLITCIAANTGELTYILNDMGKFRAWCELVNPQCLAVDRVGNIHYDSFEGALSNTSNFRSPTILYEPRHHAASLQSRELADLDSPEYSTRVVEEEEEL